MDNNTAEDVPAIGQSSEQTAEKQQEPVPDEPVNQTPEVKNEQVVPSDTPQNEEQKPAESKNTAETLQDASVKSESVEPKAEEQPKEQEKAQDGDAGGGKETSGDGQTERAQTGSVVEQSEETKPKAPESRFPAHPKFKNMEQVTPALDEYMEFLKSQETFDNKDVLNVLKGIGRMYWDMKKSRGIIGKKLADMGFADLVKKMTIYFNRIGIFKSDSIWFPCYYTLNNMWNFTDVSVELAKAAADVGMIHYYTLNLSHEPYLENKTSKNVSYVLKSSLSTLQNIIRLYPESKPIFHDEKVQKVIEPFLNDTDEFRKCLAILTLSLLLSEDETAQLEDNGSIKFIITGIRRALRSEKRRFRGFTPLELTEGLSRIAVNDSNKKKIVDEGALPHLVELMNATSEDEQLHAAKTIWTLCFDEYSKQKVQEQENLVETLEKLANSVNKAVKHAASGAIWKLRGEKQHQREKTDMPREGRGVQDKHIFISYNHEHKDIVHKINERLKADGFNRWIDTEQMGGSTLEAMALAVENAYVVLVCASEKYKLSPNCRTEAEYTFTLKKPIIPLMMQRRYKPDGWLGMLMGAKLYINFDGKFDFEVAYQMLLKEMAPYTGHDQTDQATEQQPIVKAAGRQAGDVFAGVPAHQQNSPRPSSGLVSLPQREYEAQQWTKDQVQEWINSRQFDSTLNDKLLALLNSMDGRLLVAFCHMKYKAADFFYNKLAQQCDADMLQLVHLTDALDQLP